MPSERRQAYCPRRHPPRSKNGQRHRSRPPIGGHSCGQPQRIHAEANDQGRLRAVGPVRKLGNQLLKCCAAAATTATAVFALIATEVDLKWRPAVDNSCLQRACPRTGTVRRGGSVHQQRAERLPAQDHLHLRRKTAGRCPRHRAS